MNQFINQLISAIFQVLLFGIIPLLWWLIFQRKNTTFTNFLGLKKIQSDKKSKLIIFSVIALILFAGIGYFSLKTVSSPSILANSKFSDLSFWSILSIILYSFVQTALSEELFFRGFVAKRLINQFSFKTGNLIQAVLFGLIHILLLFTQNTSIYLIIFIGLFTSIIGYVLCYIDEKMATGSIIPSWLIHGITNVISCILVIVLFS